jgi:hypothetical protein
MSMIDDILSATAHESRNSVKARTVGTPLRKLLPLKKPPKCTENGIVMVSYGKLRTMGFSHIIMVAIVYMDNDPYGLPMFC